MQKKFSEFKRSGFRQFLGVGTSEAVQHYHPVEILTLGPTVGDLSQRDAQSWTRAAAFTSTLWNGASDQLFDIKGAWA